MKKFLLWLSAGLLLFNGCSSENKPGESRSLTASKQEEPAEATGRLGRKYALPLEINIKVPEEVPPEISRPAPPLEE